MFRTITLTGLLACLFVTGSQAAEETFKDRTSGTSFPLTISIKDGDNDLTLEATGSDTRKKMFAKVYAIAHYMQDAKKGSSQEIFDQVFDDKIAKQMTMVFLRSVSKNKIRSGTTEAFRQVNSPEDANRLQGDLNQFIGFTESNISDGEKHEIRWLPGGRVQFFVDGQMKGELKSPDFAKALWRIWMSPKGVVNSNSMISLIAN